jgi:membrane-associated phospholipid phosphatase
MFVLTLLILSALACTCIEIIYQDSLETVGTSMILTLQSYGNFWLNLTFEILGEVTGAMFLSASGAIYLCGYKNVGFLASYSGFFGAALSGTAKMLISHPRPFLKEEGIQNFTCPVDWGSPSGHASSAGAAMWVLGYFWMKDNTQIKMKGLFFVVCTFIIAVDRVYLGVHFPFQVILGYSYSAVVARYFIKLSQKTSPENKSFLITEHLKITAFCIFNLFIYNSVTAEVPENWKNNYLEKCGKVFTVETAMVKNVTEGLYPLIVAGLLTGLHLTSHQREKYGSLKEFIIGNILCVALIVYCLVIDKLCLKLLPFGIRLFILSINRYFSGLCLGFVGPFLMKYLLKNTSKQD